MNEQVRLDCNLASRLVTGPGSPTDFVSGLAVQHGNIVQANLVLHNTEDAYKGPVAEDYRCQVSVDRSEAPFLGVRLVVSARNAIPSPIFKTTDSNTFESSDGRWIQFGQPRSVKLQSNTLPESEWNTPRLAFGDPEDCDTTVVETPHTWELFFDPHGHAEFGPCFGRSKRISFLLDVNQ
jgi:hypothetical protein